MVMKLENWENKKNSIKKRLEIHDRQVKRAKESYDYVFNEREVVLLELAGVEKTIREFGEPFAGAKDVTGL